MIKNVLSDIGGVGLYGVISICLFFAVFTGMVIWAFSMKKSFAQKMSASPLQDGEMKSSSSSSSFSSSNHAGRIEDEDEQARIRTHLN